MEIHRKVVLDAVYQTLSILVCSEEGEDPDDVKGITCYVHTTVRLHTEFSGTTIASNFLYKRQMTGKMIDFLWKNQRYNCR